MSDERLKRSTADDVRQSRASEDRAATDDRKKDDGERLNRFLDALQESHLPKLPEIPGYHLFWGTTTSQTDTIQNRLRAGYELVTKEDVKGFEAPTLSSGTFEGYVGVNEMVALKLPQEVFQAAMNKFHHRDPLAHEGRLNAVLDVIRENARQRGIPIRDYNGITEEEFEGRGR
jgi:hypothetical protein